MSREDILRQLAEHRTDLNEFHVKSLALFGSAARDDVREQSDIDILVEFDGTSTFDRYMGLKIYLEDLLKRDVDLVTLKSLHPRVRPFVEREALYVS